MSTLNDIPPAQMIAAKQFTKATFGIANDIIQHIYNCSREGETECVVAGPHLDLVVEKLMAGGYSVHYADDAYHVSWKSELDKIQLEVQQRAEAKRLALLAQQEAEAERLRLLAEQEAAQRAAEAAEAMRLRLIEEEAQEQERMKLLVVQQEAELVEMRRVYLEQVAELQALRPLAEQMAAAEEAARLEAERLAALVEKEAEAQALAQIEEPANPKP